MDKLELFCSLYCQIKRVLGKLLKIYKVTAWEEECMHKIQAVQQKSSYLVGMTSLVLALLIGYLNSNSGSRAAAQAQDRQSSSSALSISLPALSSEALQPFQGEWHFHSSLLTVGSDGYATFITRAYHFCRPGILQPCDAWQGNTIIPGIQEKIVLTKIDGTTAYGIITSSTDNQTQRQVTLTLQPNDTLEFNGMLLCGPDGPIGHCGA